MSSSFGQQISGVDRKLDSAHGKLDIIQRQSTLEGKLDAMMSISHILSHHKVDEKLPYHILHYNSRLILFVRITA